MQGEETNVNLKAHNYMDMRKNVKTGQSEAVQGMKGELSPILIEVLSKNLYELTCVLFERGYGINSSILIDLVGATPIVAERVANQEDRLLVMENERGFVGVLAKDRFVTKAYYEAFTKLGEEFRKLDFMVSLILVNNSQVCNVATGQYFTAVEWDQYPGDGGLSIVSFVYPFEELDKGSLFTEMPKKKEELEYYEKALEDLKTSLAKTQYKERSFVFTRNAGNIYLLEVFTNVEEKAEYGATIVLVEHDWSQGMGRSNVTLDEDVSKDVRDSVLKTIQRLQSGEVIWGFDSVCFTCRSAVSGFAKNVPGAGYLLVLE